MSRFEKRNKASKNYKEKDIKWKRKRECVSKVKRVFKKAKFIRVKLKIKLDARHLKIDFIVFEIIKISAFYLLISFSLPVRDAAETLEKKVDDASSFDSSEVEELALLVLLLILL